MKRLALLAVFQVLTLLGWASYHEWIWATAPTFRVPLRPRDPFDLLRGRYFVLNPVDGAIESGASSIPGAQIEKLLEESTYFSDRVDVGFCPSAGVYRVCAIARRGERSEGLAPFWATGFANLQRKDNGWSLDLDLGLRRFFIPNRLGLPGPENAEGWEVEVCHRPDLALLPKRLFFKGVPVGLR